jgi:N-acetylneuraminic acid mutarotase
LNINNYVYCYGGLDVGPKGELKIIKDMYCFNLNSNEWSTITFKDKYPNDRCDFSFNKLINIGILYGGTSLTKEQMYNELWVFNSKDQKWSLLDTQVLNI